MTLGILLSFPFLSWFDLGPHRAWAIYSFNNYFLVLTWPVLTYAGHQGWVLVPSTPSAKQAGHFLLFCCPTRLFHRATDSYLFILFFPPEIFCGSPKPLMTFKALPKVPSSLSGLTWLHAPPYALH